MVLIRPLPEGGAFLNLYMFGVLVLLLVLLVKISGLREQCVGYFLGRIGGATTFASAKVKNAISRIGIFAHYIYEAGRKISRQNQLLCGNLFVMFSRKFVHT